MSIGRDNECCYTCVGCGLTTCRDMQPSPAEADGLCRDCFEVEDPEGAA